MFNTNKQSVKSNIEKTIVVAGTVTMWQNIENTIVVAGTITIRQS